MRIKLNKLQTKLAVIKKYGGVCACCGEWRYEFLTIDHHHEHHKNGRKHRHEFTNGHPDRFYNHLLRKPVVPGLRVLCMNCNWANRYKEKCPHEHRLVDGFTDYSI